MACRATRDASELIRVARVDGGLVVGSHGPGRGAWVGPAPTCLDTALTRRALARALGREPSDHEVERLRREWADRGPRPVPEWCAGRPRGR